VSNLTLAIDDDLLRRARIRALEEGTSVNAVVREYLEVYAHADVREAAIRRFLELAAASEAGSAGTHRGWSRGDLYEERLRR
jgi:plasmid stability protein